MESAKQYIVNCVQALLNLPNPPTKLSSVQTLDNFMIGDKKCLTLQYC